MEAEATSGNLPEDRRRRIFLSYGHDDAGAPLATRLKQDLEKRGHEVWLDLDRLKTGVDWNTRIAEGVEWARGPSGRFILLITPHSVGREEGYCLNELQLALDLKVLVFPVIVVWYQPPLSIYRIQRVDMHDCVPLPEREGRYKDQFQTLADALESQDPPKFDTLDSRLLDCLKPLEYGADIRVHFPGFTGRKWVFDEIDQWLAKPKTSRIFGITGLAGTGKSAIAAYLCATREGVAAFHICRYGDKDKADPRRCVASIAYQLSKQLPAYQQQLGALNNLESLIANGNAQALFDQLILQPLAQVPDPGRKVVIVIDALDEANAEDENDLASLIAGEFGKSPDWLGLIVTTRPVREVTDPLQEMDGIDLETSRPENVDDIREYASKQLQPLTDNAELRASAATAVADRSEGVFLYAHWVCEELKRGHLSVDEVEDFPQGLSGAYYQFFQRQFPKLKDYQSDVEPVLGLLTAAYDFLRKEIVAEIFKWTDRQITDFFDPLAALFPCVEGRYRPFHLSILEWLSDRARNKTYNVSVKDAHQRLANYCWNQCARYVRDNLRLADYRRYAFRHGVRHLVESGRYADAVELLDYLVRHKDELKPEDRLELDQLAKLVTIALGERPSEDSETACAAWVAEAERIAPKKLAGLIKGLYMTKPQYGGIRLLVEYHRNDWPEIQEDFLRTDDYVLRNTMAKALADDFLETREDARLEAIYKLMSDEDLNHQELGAYAIQQIYADSPSLIQAKYLNLLANGKTYPFRSALGDLLIGLALQDKDAETFDRLEVMNAVDASSLFWNPIWDFNRMDVRWLKAIHYFIRDREPPADVSPDIREAHDSLRQTDNQRKELLARKVIPKADDTPDPLDSYYRLAVNSDCMDSAKNASKGDLQAIFEVLFAHPYWRVTEEAASLLASIVDEDSSAAKHIQLLFEHKLWRVQYGAAEAAFVARFKNNNRLFRQAINRFYKHREPLLRGDCVENLAAWIVDSSPSERRALLLEFKEQLVYWLREDQDCWVLDHVYRLFNQLESEGYQAEVAPLLQGGVSYLLEGAPVWYTMKRGDFLTRIEERKQTRERAEPKVAAQSAPKS